ncbi:MAG: DEAD/DEAH box helicase [Thermoplasmataceae archaeon]
MSVRDLLIPPIKELLDKYGIDQFTEAQEKLIPEVLNGDDAILISPTGSGKTEAAILPVFQKIIEGSLAPISALFITPLRALNRDILGRLQEYGQNLGIRIQVRHSDMSDAQRKDLRDNPAHIIVTTPESVQILLNSKKMDESLRNVKYVIVDELHELGQNERGTQLSIGLERLRELSGDFQRIGLSATVGNPEDLSRFLKSDGTVHVIKTSMEKEISIEVSIAENAKPEIAEKMGCDPEYAGAISMIHDLVESHNGTLVFVNTRSVAEDIAFRMSLYYKETLLKVHHGSLSRDVREEAEMLFKKGGIKGLICTSSLELGIDIGSADLVIQFNSPRQINKLIQRTGRSGHWIKKRSKGIIICSDIIELEEAMAIVGQVYDKRLEPVIIRKGSMATVANQIILEVQRLKSFDSNKFFSTVSRSYPLSDMSREQYDEVVNFLVETRKIRIDENIISRRAGTLDYFITNISMIPSERNYRVIDVINRRFVGTLDERYVLNEIEPGSYFVIRGATWRTIRIEEEKILVEPFQTAALAPKWTGEDIPVLPDVVRRVSENRKRKIVHEYVTGKSRAILKEWYENDSGTVDRVIIESQGSEIVIQSMLGTRGNFALTEILGGMLTAITGESVESDYSPYHIFFRVSRRMRSEDIQQMISGIDKERMMSYIEASARRSRFFTNVFLYEARKFGVIRNDADISRIRFDKIVESYMDTVLYRDSVRKMIADYMDLNSVADFLEKIQNKAVQFSCRDRISESSEVFLTHYSERIMPLKPTKAIIESVTSRLMNEEITLLCLSCRNTRTMKVRDVTTTRCPSCGSSLVAGISHYEKNEIKEGINSGKIDEKTLRRLRKNAHLVKERGKKAIIALSGRGIGSETASRILSVGYYNDEDFIKEILNSEMEYARNRRFWS